MNELSDFNEMLCERLGVGEGEDVGFAEWRRKREGERKKVQEEKLSLQREVQRKCMVYCGLHWSCCGLHWSLHWSVHSTSSVWLAIVEWLQILW